MSDHAPNCNVFTCEICGLGAGADTHTAFMPMCEFRPYECDCEPQIGSGNQLLPSAERAADRAGAQRDDYPNTSATPSLVASEDAGHAQEDWITRFDTRLQSKLTPALNSGTAMEMLILVGETLRELRAEDAGQKREPELMRATPTEPGSSEVVPQTVEKVRQRFIQEWASWEPETGAEFERDVDALIEAVRLSTLSQQTGTGLNTDHAGDA